MLLKQEKDIENAEQKKILEKKIIQTRRRKDGKKDVEKMEERCRKDGKKMQKRWKKDIEKMETLKILKNVEKFRKMLKK